MSEAHIRKIFGTYLEHTLYVPNMFLMSFWPIWPKMPQHIHLFNFKML